MSLNISFDRFQESISSFQMVRTNPKLTGNVKISVDFNEDIWFNSIDANEQLASSEYKKFPISLTDKHGVNLRNFFRAGKTPLNIIFDVKKEVDDKSTSSDYANQFDFSGYTSGAKYLKSKFYDERFSYFAPLYLKGDIPQYFVIFRIDGPMNNSQTLNETVINNKEYFLKILREAKVIKTFDLSEETNIGKYVKSIFNDSKNNNSDIDIRFNKDNFTYWNGYSIKSGSYVSRGEYMQKTFEDDSPIKIFEKYVTTGYERQGIINPHIVNLEFFFEDTFADYYDMNRYIGFYVNSIDMVDMEFDTDRLYEMQNDLGNLPVIKVKPKFIDESRIMTNTNGVKLPFVGNITDIGPLDFMINSNNMILPYITGKDKTFYTLDPDNPFEVYHIDEFDYALFNIRNKSMDVGNMYGTDRVLLQQKASQLDKQGRSFIWMEFTDDLSNFDRFLIYHINGSKFDDTLNLNYDEIHVFNEFTPTSNPGEYYVYEDYVDPIDSSIYDLYYINGKMLHGRPESIVEAISGALNTLEKMPFNIYTEDGKILFVNKAEGNQDSKFSIKFISTSSSYPYVTINRYTSNDLIDTIIYAEGGSDDCYRVKVDAKYYEYLTDNLGNILLKTNKFWEYLHKLSYDVDAIDTGNISGIFNNIVLCIDKTYTDGLDITGNFILIKREFHSQLGLFSFYPLKDFDFGFTDTTYNRMPLWEIYKYFFIPPNTNLIKEGIWYKVVGDGIIEYNSIEYKADEIFQGIVNKTSYTLKEGNTYIIYSSETSSGTDLLDIPLYDGDKDIQRFNGYFAIRDPFLEKEKTDNYDTRDVFFDNMLTSEYHYYRENFVPELAMDSRLVPYISKWGYVDGKNIRDVNYRLNNHISFGINNFSPDHFESTQNPLNMTHEWYYLISDYDFINDISVKVSNYSYFPTELDLLQTSAIFTVETEFEEFFNYTYVNQETQLSKTQERYSYIKYNKVFNRYETFFRGVKMIFNERDLSNDEALPSGKPPVKVKSRRFDDYRFTVVLIPKQEDILGTAPPITYNFYESKENKFIIFAIELYIGDITNVDTTIPEITVDNYREMLTKSSPSDSTADGDYRISFNEQGISDLTYLYLYSVHNKKFSNLLNNFSTIKLTDIYRFDLLQSLGGDNYLINAEANPNFTNYKFNVGNEIQSFNGVSVMMMDHIALTDLFFNLVDPISSPVQIISDNPMFQTIDRGVKIKKKSYQDFYLTYGENSLYTSIPTTSVPTNFRQVMGGKNYYKNIFSMISFAQIKEYINSIDPVIEYNTWNSTGFTSNEFYVTIVNPDKVKKMNTIVPVVNESLKIELGSESDVSFDLYKQSIKQGYDILRYSGEYEPIFKDILFFDRDVNLPENGISNIFMSNTKFATDVADFAVLKDFTHLKISDKSVLKTESDLKLYPIYELIDEITIGNADYYYFLSNWEYGYHKKYIDKINHIDVHGSLRIEEDYNFVAKLIKLKEELELLEFEVTTHNARSNIDNLDFSQYEIVVQDVDNTIVGYINIKNMLIRYLYEDGIYDLIKTYLIYNVTTLGKLTMREYVNSYIETNIIDLYNVDTITFLGEDYNNDVDASNLFSSSLTTNSKEFKGVDINKKEKYLYKFTYTKKDGDNKKIKFKTKIKLI